MKEKRDFFYYMGQVIISFGITILLLNLFCVAFGESAQEISTMFELGNRGLSVATMMQFLLMSVIGIALRQLFFQDSLIKRMSLLLRTVCLLVSLFLAISVFAVIFRWFPVDDVAGWILFVITFLLCTVISILITLYREKRENSRLEEALERLKQKK